MNDEPGLAEAIAGVRSALRTAQNEGWGTDVRFTVGTVEVEFAVEVVKERGGQASIKVLNLLSLGGKAGVSTGFTNTVRVILNPVDSDGGPYEVYAPGDHRPDVNQEADLTRPSELDIERERSTGSTGRASGRPGG